jgi:hypothetical protein
MEETNKGIWRGFSWSFAILLAAIVAGFLLWADPAKLMSLPFKDNMAAAAATVIGAILVVTLIVERSMATVNAILFGEEERQAELELMQATQAGGDTNPAQNKIKKVMDKKARVRLLLGFAVGLLVSASGVRTLEGLLNSAGRVNDLLFPVDVVLTAGLIAGGSAALAVLAQVLKDLAAPPPEADSPADPAGEEPANPAVAEAREATLGGVRPRRRRPARNFRARLV